MYEFLFLQDVLAVLSSGMFVWVGTKFGFAIGVIISVGYLIYKMAKTAWDWVDDASSEVDITCGNELDVVWPFVVVLTVIISCVGGGAALSLMLYFYDVTLYALLVVSVMFLARYVRRMHKALHTHVKDKDAHK